MLRAMTYRPYPARDRALRHILRRHRNELPPALLLHAAQPSGCEAGERLRAAFTALPSAGSYVLSTRRPGVVGGDR